jgi:acyl-CoA synthetase (AMP-forming)/AMP-acid ligase II
MPYPTPYPWDAPPTRHEAHFGRVIPCFRDRPRHLNELMAHTVSRYGKREALVDGDTRLTYAALDGIARRVAAGLAADGVAAGDRVILLVTNRAEFMTALLGVLRRGAIAVPVNVREERDGITFVANQCGAKAIVFDAALAERVATPAEAPTIALRYAIGGAVGGAHAFARLAESSAAPVAPAAPAEEDTAVLLYTSGTTGRPKGAMLTHLNIVHSVMHFAACMNNTCNDRSMLAVPASHVTGLVAITLSMFYVGGCVLVMGEFKAAPFLALASRERMTHTLVVPAIYNLLLRHPDFDGTDLSRWRVGGYGGAPMPELTINQLATKLPNLVLQNAYGSTETTSPTTVVPAGQQAAHLASVGRIVTCGDVRVMDDDGRELAAGEAGELWIGGPMVVPGYWDNPEATVREFVGGYWKSGDIGRIDADGYVYVFDRKKDMINRAGYKVYCAEVESVLAAHEAVIEAALVAQPDPVLGEKSRAFVVAREGASAEVLRAYCAKHLADYKVPDFFTFLAEPLPRNANGKVLKRSLRERSPA